MSFSSTFYFLNSSPKIARDDAVTMQLRLGSARQQSLIVLECSQKSHNDR